MKKFLSLSFLLVAIISIAQQPTYNPFQPSYTPVINNSASFGPNSIVIASGGSVDQYGTNVASGSTITFLPGTYNITNTFLVPTNGALYIMPGAWITNWTRIGSGTDDPTNQCLFVPTDNSFLYNYGVMVMGITNPSPILSAFFGFAKAGIGKPDRTATNFYCYAGKMIGASDVIFFSSPSSSKGTIDGLNAESQWDIVAVSGPSSILVKQPYMRNFGFSGTGTGLRVFGTAGATITSINGYYWFSGSDSLAPIDIEVGSTVNLVGGYFTNTVANNNVIFTGAGTLNISGNPNLAYTDIVSPTTGTINFLTGLVSGTGVQSITTHTPVSVGSLGSSPFNYTNVSSLAQEVYFSGSVAYSVTKNGAAVFASLAGDAYLILQPNSRVAVTFTVAPTFLTNSW